MRLLTTISRNINQIPLEKENLKLNSDFVFSGFIKNAEVPAKSTKTGAQ